MQQRRLVARGLWIALGLLALGLVIAQVVQASSRELESVVFVASESLSPDQVELEIGGVSWVIVRDDKGDVDHLWRPIGAVERWCRMLCKNGELDCVYWPTGERKCEGRLEMIEFATPEVVLERATAALESAKAALESVRTEAHEEWR